MDDAQKKYILENAGKMSSGKIARALGLPERHVRKFLESEKGKQKPVATPVAVPLQVTSSLSVQQWLLVCLSLLGLGFLIYSNTFHASFHFDDNWSIVKNPGVRDAFDLGFVWKSYGLRLFTYFTLGLNFRLGQLDVLGYHLVNISIHVFTSILMFLFLYLTAQTPSIKRNPPLLSAFWMAFGGALLFVSHPLQTQAVTYIVQRATSMAALFYVSAMVCYIQWRLQKHLLFYGLAIASFILAILSKEISVTLPFALLLYEFCFFDRGERKFSKVILWLAPFFFLLLIFIPFFYCGFRLTGNEKIAISETQNISRGTYLLTQFRVITTYIRLLFFPIHQTLDYYFPLSRTPADPATFSSFLFLVGILSSAVALFRRYRFYAFGVFWFFLTLSVESSIIPIRDVINEHRVYLPMPGFCFVFCGMLCWRIRDLKKWWILLIVIVTTLSFLTYRRNAVWQTDLTLWGDVIRKAPMSDKGYIMTGVAYQNQGRYAEAIPYHLKAMELAPSSTPTIDSLAAAYTGAGQYGKAVEILKQGIEACDDSCALLYDHLGEALNLMGRYDEAIKNYLQAIKLDPNFSHAYLNLGMVYIGEGKSQKVLEQVRALENLRHMEFIEKLLKSMNKRALELKGERQYEKAIEFFKALIQHFGDKVPALYINLGLTLDDMGRYDEAIENYLHVIKIDPGFPDAYLNLGMDYVKKGELEKAKEQVRALENLGQIDSAKKLADNIENQKKEVV